MFIFLSKKEIKERRLETMKIARILDDVDWMYGAKSRIKRHERSEWAQKVLASGEVISSNSVQLPEWLAKRLEALPQNCGAKLCLNLSEYPLPEFTGIVDEKRLTVNLLGMEADPDQVVTFEDIRKEFGNRKHGALFSDLVQYYVKTKFNNSQARTAQAAHLDPQVVNQIYNAQRIASRKKGRVARVSQRTVIALGMAFELTLDEAEEFMQSAGYAFSNTEDDVLFKLCFKRRFYSISKINELLQTIQMTELGTRVSKPKNEKNKRERDL